MNISVPKLVESFREYLLLTDVPMDKSKKVSLTLPSLDVLHSLRDKPGPLPADILAVDGVVIMKYRVQNDGAYTPGLS